MALNHYKIGKFSLENLEMVLTPSIKERVLRFFVTRNQPEKVYVQKKKGVYLMGFKGEEIEKLYQSINKIQYYGLVEDHKIFVSNEKNLLKVFDSEMKFKAVLKLDKGKVRSVSSFSKFFAL